MKKAESLVIDASVAHASGKSEHPHARSCRLFLEEMMQQKMLVAETRELCAEWKNHSSNYFRKWRVNMYGRRLQKTLHDVRDEDFRNAIDKLVIPESKLDALQKDVHLFEAAFVSDECIISLDEEMREISREVTVAINRLKNILWLNPTKSEETPIEWLQQGAHLENRRKLGNWKT
jgi:hypothetical protein